MINLKKLPGICAVSVLTLASMSSSAVSISTASGINPMYTYEGLSLLNDNGGELCRSSVTELSNDIKTNEENILDFVSKKPSRAIKLNIVSIKKHQSQFDFEEEFEEL